MRALSPPSDHDFWMLIWSNNTTAGKTEQYLWFFYRFHMQIMWYGHGFSTEYRSTLSSLKAALWLMWKLGGVLHFWYSRMSLDYLEIDRNTRIPIHRCSFYFKVPGVWLNSREKMGCVRSSHEDETGDYLIFAHYSLPFALIWSVQAGFVASCSEKWTKKRFLSIYEDDFCCNTFV
jgi:hypothetical protein